MKRFRPFATALLCICAPALAQDVITAAPLGDPATTIYRQITEDGRVIYSDKPQKGAAIDHTLEVQPPTKGGLWSVEGGPRPEIPPQVEPTPIKQVSSIPASGKRKTVEEATSDVIRAEMLLEDARVKHGTGPEVAKAESVLRQAIVARDKLRKRR